MTPLVFFTENRVEIGRAEIPDDRVPPRAVFWRGRFFVKAERMTTAGAYRYEEVATYDMAIEDMKPVPRDRT